MDPVAFWLIVFALGTTVLYTGTSIKKLFKNGHKNLVKRRKKKRARSKKTHEEQFKEDQIRKTQMMKETQRQVIEFTSLKDPSKKIKREVEISSKFDPARDMLYRGKIASKVKEYDQKDVYLYQPRVDFISTDKDGKLVKKYAGPITDPNTGHVLEYGTYAIKVDGEYYIGNVSKITVDGNVPFDYVRNSDHGDKKFEEYLTIDCKRDSDGNLIQENLNEESAKKNYAEYLEAKATDRTNDQDYYLTMERKARELQQKEIEEALEAEEKRKEEAREEQYAEEMAKKEASKPKEKIVDVEAEAYDRDIEAQKTARYYQEVQENMGPNIYGNGVKPAGGMNHQGMPNHGEGPEEGHGKGRH